MSPSHCGPTLYGSPHCLGDPMWDDSIEMPLEFTYLLVVLLPLVA